MPEETIPNTTAEPSAPPAQQAGQVGTPDVDSLRQQLERANQRVTGMQGFFDSARKAGFEKPEQFEEISGLTTLLKERGLSPKQITELLAGKQPEQRQSDFDPAAFEKKMMKDWEDRQAQREAFSRAESEHQRLLKADESLMGEMLKDIEDEFDRTTYSDALRMRYEQSRRSDKYLYDSGHPYREHDFRPLGEQAVKAMVDEFKKGLQARKGAAIKKAGQPASTPAGASPGSGTSNKEGTEPPKRPTRDESIAKLQARRAARQSV